MTRLGRVLADIEYQVATAAATSDHAALARLGAAVAAVQDELSAVEERWLALTEELG